MRLILTRTKSTRFLRFPERLKGAVRRSSDPAISLPELEGLTDLNNAAKKENGARGFKIARQRFGIPRSGRVCRRHRHRLYHRDSQDGVDFLPHKAE
jgi:hypothetical protein